MGKFGRPDDSVGSRQTDRNVRNDSPELLEEQLTPPKEPSLFDDAPL
jgi:hypothetical protein